MAGIAFEMPRVYYLPSLPKSGIMWAPGAVEEASEGRCGSHKPMTKTRTLILAAGFKTAIFILHRSGSGRLRSKCPPPDVAAHLGARARQG